MENRYLVDSVVRACRLLAAFHDPQETLRLKELAERADLSVATAFRLLRTLEHCRMVERVDGKSYRCAFHSASPSRYRLGYASEPEDPSFVQEWSVSIVEACAAERIELLTYDNGGDAETALGNVDRMIRDRVQLVIEHQRNDRIAPIVASKLAEAGIPLIAMGAAHPGAIYFGGNNYLAGQIGGRALGQWAKRRWKGQVEQLVLLELEAGGPLLESRLSGVEFGLREVLPDFDPARVQRLSGSGLLDASLDLMRRHLAHTHDRRILVGAANDPCALGALRALEEAGWEEGECAVMGQGGSAEGRQELRRPGTRLAGTVAFFPEKYGAHIVRIALDLLSGKAVPPAVFVKHQLLTPANVDHYYPHDRLGIQQPAQAG